MRLVLGWTFLLGVVAGCGGGGDMKAPLKSSSGAPLAHGGTDQHPSMVPFSATVAATVGATSCAHHVTLNGNPGTVIGKASITSVFWGSYWAGTGAAERTTYDSQWRDVGNNSAFYARLAEYSTSVQTIQTGAWIGSVMNNSALASGTTITEDQIQQELSAEIGAGTVPALTSNSLYVVILPPGVTSQFDQQNNFAGHHRQFVDSARGSLPIRYAVITYSTDTQYTNPVISHEISEAITDPDLATGWWDTGDGEEIGDICRFNYAQLDGFQIEEIWSQQQCACVGAVQTTQNSCTAPAWSASSVYTGGMTVSFGNNQYTAAFWNTNMEPDKNNGPAGSGQPWQSPVPCSSTTCTPSCTGKTCGSDGCTGSCGTCGTGQMCDASQQCVCAPSCSGKSCGGDGCGGSCGTCAAGQTCNTYQQCVCVPSCSGKSCGDDGCGGSCGTCAAGQTCSNSGTCQAGGNSCAGLTAWDPNQPWYVYTTGEQHIGSNNHRYACKNVAYCIYDPTSSVGATYGWTDEGPC
jgi:hypothetical protein